MRLEADLRRRLQAIDEKKGEKKQENGKPADGKDKKNGKPEDKQTEPEANGKGGNGKDGGKEKKPNPKGEIDGAEDFQLQRALDLLRAIDIYHQVTPAS